MRRGSRKALMIVQRQPVMGLIGVLRRALTYWRPYWVQGLLLVAATLLQQALNTFLAVSLKLIIDRALAARDGVMLLWILAGLAGGFIVALFANLCADYLTARVGANILNDLRLKMFSHLQHLSMDFFHRARTGNIVAYFSSDLADIEKGLTSRVADALLALHEHLSVGALVAFMSLLSSVKKDAYNLTKKVVPSLITATGGLQRIEDLLCQRPRIIDARRAQSLPRLAKEIRFEDVSFSYTGEQLHLNHVSFTILAGEMVAFVGPSGAGKSTILSLLARFYDVAAGAVTIDGHDLRRVTQESLRAQMGFVFQDTFLFNATIRDNIRMGKLDATDAEVEAAARAAEIHDLIMRLPRGYDTPTGELGALLSGGQRQRIAIARAIIRDPAMLILDEATSALDPATETAIMATLRRLARNRTVVAVTHRLAAIHSADRIFVVDSGCVVEDGQHDELLQRRGLYHELWGKQDHGSAAISLRPSSNALGARMLP